MANAIHRLEGRYITGSQMMGARMCFAGVFLKRYLAATLVSCAYENNKERVVGQDTMVLVIQRGNFQGVFRASKNVIVTRLGKNYTDATSHVSN